MYTNSCMQYICIQGIRWCSVDKGEGVSFFGEKKYLCFGFHKKSLSERTVKRKKLNNFKLLRSLKNKNFYQSCQNINHLSQSPKLLIFIDNFVNYTTVCTTG